MRYSIGVLGLIMAAMAFGADGDDRAKLIGAWESHSDGVRWILAENGDTIHVTHVQKDRKLADFECNTAGRECNVKESGKAVKVSMWFNGPKLVLMETRGSEVVKHAFEVAKDGTAIELETIPIVPEGKPETARLDRAAQ